MRLVVWEKWDSKYVASVIRKNPLMLTLRDHSEYDCIEICTSGSSWEPGIPKSRAPEDGVTQKAALKACVSSHPKKSQTSGFLYQLRLCCSAHSSIVTIVSQYFNTVVLILKYICCTWVLWCIWVTNTLWSHVKIDLSVMTYSHYS